MTFASDIYSLGCLLCKLLTGDVPFDGTDSMPLRAHHLQTPAPSVLGRRADIPVALDVLLSSMLAKDPQERLSAEAVYEALLPLASTPSDPATGGDESRDPTRPFRRLLLAPAEQREEPTDRGKLTDAEADELQANVRVLLDNDRPSEAIRLLEDGVARAAHEPFLNLRLRHFLAAAHFYAGEYNRAATLFEVVGRDYRKHLPSTDSYVLDCAYHAGHAYAEVGKPDKALPQLRFYVQNADASASRDTADQIR
ncbi:hypothetical protein ACFWOX_35365 [Streptomyces sp. NPDC058467]|uniref:protein kinase domain-containing protein n=1 Tax=Streptomyces sp. NPDC058467 TaxID=3346513 RepID=UPI00364D4435